MADMMRRPELERNRQSGALRRTVDDVQMGTIAGHSQLAFDALKLEFPGLADPADRQAAALAKAKPTGAFLS
jgi:hypothetical protein